MKINLREAVVALLIFVMVFATVQFSMESYQVDGTSMMPTFRPKDCIMVDKLTYRFTGPERGQVVILWPPKDEVPSAKNPYIKRVIGLPGETVRTDASGQVYITNADGEEFKLVEDPEMPPCYVTNGSWHLEKDEYFVLGDNRGNSRDSTYFRAVKKGNFIGKTWLRCWPMSQFGLTPHYSYTLVSDEEPSPTSLDVLPAIESSSLSLSTP